MAFAAQRPAAGSELTPALQAMPSPPKPEFSFQSVSDLNPTPTVRPYRFGMVLGVLNLLAATYYGWLAVSSGNVAGVMVLGFSAPLALGTGIGLVRKRTYGVALLYLSFLMTVVEMVSDWFKPHAWGLLYYVLLNLAFFSALFAIVGYFYKRRGEFR